MADCEMNNSSAALVKELVSMTLIKYSKDFKFMIFLLFNIN